MIEILILNLRPGMRDQFTRYLRVSHCHYSENGKLMWWHMGLHFMMKAVITSFALSKVYRRESKWKIFFTAVMIGAKVREKQYWA